MKVNPLRWKRVFRQCDLPANWSIHNRHLSLGTRGQAGLGPFHGSRLQDSETQPNQHPSAEARPYAAQAELLQAMAPVACRVQVVNCC